MTTRLKAALAFAGALLATEAASAQAPTKSSRNLDSPEPRTAVVGAARYPRADRRDKAEKRQERRSGAAVATLAG